MFKCYKITEIISLSHQKIMIRLLLYLFSLPLGEVKEFFFVFCKKEALIVKEVVSFLYSKSLYRYGQDSLDTQYRDKKMILLLFLLLLLSMLRTNSRHKPASHLLLLKSFISYARDLP